MMSGFTHRARPNERDGPANNITEQELAALGRTRLAYIRIISSDEAKRTYEGCEGIPDGLALFALQMADGTPLALASSLADAVGHAVECELEIATLH